MKNWFWICSMLFFGLACEKASESLVPENPLIVGLASPVQVASGTTGINLQDYVLDPSRIDSITTDGPFTIEIEEGYTLLLSGDPTKHLYNLNLWSAGIPESILLVKTSRVDRLFVFENDAKEVRIKGEFNAWNPASTILEKTEAGFSSNVELAPGTYQYLMVVDGKEMLDPANLDSISNGMGGWNSIIHLPGSNPDLIPLVQTTDFSKDRVSFQLSNEARGVYAYWQNQLLPAEWINLKDRQLEISIPAAAAKQKRSKIRLWAFNDEGVSNDVMVPLENGNVLASADQLSREDYEAMVMYFLMVDRFNNGDPSNDKPLNIPEVHPKADYFGGDLLGVSDKIKDGYFSDLGVNTIWLSPITQNPEGAYGKYPEPETKFSGYHGYWPISNLRVDYRFGTDRQFQELVDLAHGSDMNVLLDYVANHVHEEHPIYQQNPDWATDLYLPDGTLNTEKWDEHRLTTWFDTFMPTLDLSRMEVVDPMTDSALFWLREYGIDGFRHDATKHIPEVFWRVLTRKINEQVVLETGKPVFQIGETYGSHELIKSYIKSGLLDAQFDFNMYDQAVAAFAGIGSMEELANSLRASLKYYGDHNLMGYITGNQDRPRFISYADGSLEFGEDTKYAGWNREITLQDTLAYRKLSALTAYMMSIPGIPCIYYGDEYGSPGGNDPDNRRRMMFEGLDPNQLATRERAKKMIDLRRNNLALIFGETEIRNASENSLILVRSYFDQQAIAVFNTSGQEMRFDIPVGGTPNFYGKWNSEQLVLPAFGFDILTYN